MIESTKAGLELNPNELEAHYLAGGNVTNVVHALVSAQKANIMLDFKYGYGDRSGGPRRIRSGTVCGQMQKVMDSPPVAAVAQGRYSVDRQGARYGAGQYQAVGRRCR